MNKPVGEKVEWFIRSEKPSVHRDLGKTLANDQDEVSHSESELKFDVVTNDGRWNLWSCGDRSFAASKTVLMAFLGEGKIVYLYKKIGDAQPFHFEDDEIREAREKLGKPVVAEPKSKDTPAHKAAVKRLRELKKKRKFQGVH